MKIFVKGSVSYFKPFQGFPFGVSGHSLGAALRSPQQFRGVLSVRLVLLFHAKSLVALLEGFTGAYQKNLVFGKDEIGFACFA
jgi:hypothetical protein